MFIRIMLAAIIIAAFAPPLAAQAGQGTYTTVSSTADTVAMPDGAVHLTSHYVMVTRANAPTFPLHNAKSDCVGMFRVVGETPAAASGSCFALATDGHGYSMWWQMTEGGTSGCPDLCGTWGLYGGYGRFAGVSGGGTWRRDAEFPDGSGAGTWTGTVTVGQARSR